jgi:hypothetical protein
MTKLIAALIEDPTFGLEAAGIWHPSYFGALGYAWLASITLRKALGRLDRYIHIILQMPLTAIPESGIVGIMLKRR